MKKTANKNMVADQWDIVTSVWKETLSDGSKAFNLWIGNVEMACTSEEQAYRLQKQIGEILAKEVIDIQAR